MKKIVITCGLIAGAILCIVMVTSTAMCYSRSDFEGNMLLGYASMVLAFSVIFVGIKNYRDKFNSGIITFGKAFKIGLYISLVASTCYVAVWLVEYYVFIPDFMDKFSAHLMKSTQGKSQVEIDKQVNQIATYKEMYKNPLFVILLTYSEVLPIGVVISLICSLILKRRSGGTNLVASN